MEEIIGKIVGETTGIFWSISFTPFFIINKRYINYGKKVHENDQRFSPQYTKANQSTTKLFNYTRRPIQNGLVNLRIYIGVISIPN